VREVPPASLVLRAASISDAVRQLEAAGWRWDCKRIWIERGTWRMTMDHIRGLWGYRRVA
jgi:hypothetical protein